jgi:hypothetical protein
MATKKRKICYEYLFFFNNFWVDLYFFVENKGKSLCLIFQKFNFFLKSIFSSNIRIFTLIFLCKIIKYNNIKIISIYHM